MQFSKLSNIPNSVTVAMNGKALKKRAAGERVYNLSAGEPMLDTDPRIINAAHQALLSGATHYTPVPGIPALRAAAAEYLNAYSGANYTVAQTMVTLGGKSAYNLLCQALLDPGDEVLVVKPFWVSYSSIAELYGANVQFVETSEVQDWKLQPEQIKEYVTKKTKFLVLNNGSNPTGNLYSRDELQEILRIAKEQNVLVISDEVYSGLVYDGSEYISAAAFPETRNNVVVIHSMSKNFAMTGWRVGMLFASEEIINRSKILQSQNTTCAAAVSQWASVAALQSSNEITGEIREKMQARRDVLVEAIKEKFSTEIKKPSCALYCFVPLSAFGVASDESSADFCMRVLEEAHIAMVPGSAFGVEGYVRISFGEQEGELKEAIEKLSAYLQ